MQYLQQKIKKKILDFIGQDIINSYNKALEKISKKILKDYLKL